MHFLRSGTKKPRSMGRRAKKVFLFFMRAFDSTEGTQISWRQGLKTVFIMYAFLAFFSPEKKREKGTTTQNFSYKPSKLG